MQQIDDVGLRRHAGFQGQFDGREHGLLVMLEHQGQDLDHLAVATWRLEEVLLQYPEGVRRFGKGCAVPQGTGFALHD